MSRGLAQQALRFSLPVENFGVAPVVRLGSNVRVTAILGVGKWSNDWDADYEGTVCYAILAGV
jgi:hypothetical protein